MGLLFYQAYAMVVDKELKNKKMSEQLHTQTPETDKPKYTVEYLEDPASTELIDVVEETDGAAVAETAQDEVDPCAVGNRVIVQRKNGTVEYDWTVAGYSPDNTRVVVEKFDKKLNQHLSKSPLRSSLEALKERVDANVAESLGETAVGEALSAEVQEIDPRAEERAAVEAEMTAIEATLSVDDRKNVWRFANAISDEEVANATWRLSDQIKRSNIHFKYKALNDKLRELRGL